MKTVIFNLFFGLAALSWLVSCNGDEPGPQNNSEPLFSAKINGVPFKGNNLVTVATMEWESSDRFSLSFGSGDSEDISLGQGRFISIGLVGDDFDKVKPGAEINGYSLYTGLGAIGYFYDYRTPENYAIGLTSIGEHSISIKITAIDKSNQIISGEFWFTTEANDGTQNEVTDGLFRNIKYTIEE